jgi:acetyl esterase/lipase
MRIPFLLVVISILPLSAFAGSIEKNIPYVPDGKHKQQLDLYLPAVKNFATILLVHGGSLEVGDRTEAPFPVIAAAFQREGFACAVMSYRLKGESPWPAPAQDTAAAFAWVKKNIGARGGDAKRVYALGHSSGARLVAMIGADSELLKAHGLAPKDIAGVIPMGTILNHKNALDAMEKATPEQLARAFASPDYKAFGNIEGYRRSWPQAHIGAHMPPFLILIAEEEKFQPPILARAEEFAAAARPHGVTVFVEVLAGRTHMSALEKLPERGDTTLARILTFIRQGR